MQTVTQHQRHTEHDKTYCDRNGGDAVFSLFMFK